jgi:hypothetical protein
MYTIRRDEYGHAVAIERDGYTVLHLQPGTERNEQEIERIVRELNEVQRLRAVAIKLHETINSFWQGDCEKADVVAAQSNLCDILSTTTEPIGAQRARDKMKSLFEACHYTLETGKELYGKTDDEEYCSGKEEMGNG